GGRRRGEGTMAGSAQWPKAPRAKGRAGREKAGQSTATWLPLLTGQRYLASAKLAERWREHVKTEVVRGDRQLRPRPPSVRRRRPDRWGRPGVHATAAGGDLLPRLPHGRFRYLRIVDVELHGQDRARRVPLCRGAGLRLARVPPQFG